MRGHEWCIGATTTTDLETCESGLTPENANHCLDYPCRCDDLRTGNKTAYGVLRNERLMTHPC